MKYIPYRRWHSFLSYPMALIVWLVIPDIKVIYGKLFKRHWYEFGEPKGMRE